jgi:hypothetical protein
MPKIGLVKEFNHSVSDISLIPFDLSHVSDNDSFKVLANSSKVRIPHDFLY